jgi:hypothetical protein
MTSDLPGSKLLALNMVPSAPVFADWHWRANGANQNCCSIKGTKTLLRRGHKIDPRTITSPSAHSAISRLNGLYSVAQPSKTIERLNFQRLGRFWNSDDKDLVLILFHSLMNVCKMNEVVFRDQGIFASISVVDGDRPSCAHRNSPQNYLTRDCEQRLSLF